MSNPVPTRWRYGLLLKCKGGVVSLFMRNFRDLLIGALKRVKFVRIFLISTMNLRREKKRRRVRRKWTENNRRVCPKDSVGAAVPRN